MAGLGERFCMARETYVFRSGLGVIPKHEADPLHSGDPSAYVIADGMDPILNVQNGRMYDSRSRYYADIRAAGCEVIGNDTVQRQRHEMPAVRGDLKRALQERGAL